MCHSLNKVGTGAHICSWGKNIRKLWHEDFWMVLGGKSGSWRGGGGRAGPVRFENIFLYITFFSQKTVNY
jgi:hypothetical protein